jgi:hypothetical protein
MGSDARLGGNDECREVAQGGLSHEPEETPNRSWLGIFAIPVVFHSRYHHSSPFSIPTRPKGGQTMTASNGDWKGFLNDMNVHTAKPIKPVLSPPDPSRCQHAGRDKEKNHRACPFYKKSGDDGCSAFKNFDAMTWWDTECICVLEGVPKWKQALMDKQEAMRKRESSQFHASKEQSSLL